MDVFGGAQETEEVGVMIRLDGMIFVEPLLRGGKNLFAGFGR